MKTLARDERPVVGKLLSHARNAVATAIDEWGEKVRAEEECDALAKIDISLPGTPREIGSLHPLHQMHDRAIQIFRRMGFALAEGPDIETEWYCFDALNTPPIILPATSRTRFICPTDDSYERTRQPCKSVRWNPRPRLFA